MVWYGMVSYDTQISEDILNDRKISLSLSLVVLATGRSALTRLVCAFLNCAATSLLSITTSGNYFGAHITIGLRSSLHSKGEKVSSAESQDDGDEESSLVEHHQQHNPVRDSYLHNIGECIDEIHRHIRLILEECKVSSLIHQMDSLSSEKLQAYTEEECPDHSSRILSSSIQHCIRKEPSHAVALGNMRMIRRTEGELESWEHDSTRSLTEGIIAGGATHHHAMIAVVHCSVIHLEILASSSSSDKLPL